MSCLSYHRYYSIYGHTINSTRKLVPPTVGPGGPVMAIQDGPDQPWLPATNGPSDGDLAMLNCLSLRRKSAFKGYHSLSGGVMGRTICGKGDYTYTLQQMPIVGPVGLAFILSACSFLPLPSLTDHCTLIGLKPQHQTLTATGI